MLPKRRHGHRQVDKKPRQRRSCACCKSFECRDAEVKVCAAVCFGPTDQKGRKFASSINNVVRVGLFCSEPPPMFLPPFFSVLCSSPPLPTHLVRTDNLHREPSACLSCNALPRLPKGFCTLHKKKDVVCSLEPLLSFLLPPETKPFFDQALQH